MMVRGIEFVYILLDGIPCLIFGEFACTSLNLFSRLITIGEVVILGVRAFERLRVTEHNYIIVVNLLTVQEKNHKKSLAGILIFSYPARLY